MSLTGVVGQLHKMEKEEWIQKDYLDGKREFI